MAVKPDPVPHPRPDLRVTETTDERTEALVVLLENPETGEVFRLGPEEWFLCQDSARDGDLAATRAAFQERFGITLSPADHVAFLEEMLTLGLLTRDREETAPPAEQAPPPPSESAPPLDDGPARWALFNPDPYLAFLARMLGPFRWLVWLLPLALILASVLFAERATEVEADLRAAMRGVSLLQHLLLSLFLVNLTSKVMQGVVCRRMGGPVRKFGIRLAFGFVPRFFIDRSEIRKLDRRGQIWSFSAPLLTKLTLFAAGVLVWGWTRGAGTLLPEAALVLGTMGLAAFLFTVNPLWRADGYNLTALLLGEPRLRPHAVNMLRLVLTGKPLPPELSLGKRWGLVLYGAGAIAFTVLLVGVVLALIARTLEERYSGLGVALFLGLLLMFGAWMWATARGKRQARERAIPPAPRRWWPRILQLLVLGAIVGAGFLPYPYEASGPVVLLPDRQWEVRADVSGVVIEVTAREGDWVAANQLLARLAAYDEERNLAVTEAELARAQAELQSLRDGATEEEIDRSRKTVARAEVSVKFAEREMARKRDLRRSGVVSQTALDEAQAALEEARARLDEAQADLAAVVSPPRDSEVRALEAVVQRLETELAYRKAQLARTELRAPGAGRIVTPHLGHRLGNYLAVGDLFSEIQDTRVMRAEIEIPEYEVDLIKPGEVVRLRLWGGSQVLESTVEQVAPTAEEREFGRIVRVVALLPNPDGTLRSQMTGYGKIMVGTMPAGQAFTKMLVRFFRVEVWSWLP